MAIRTRHVFHPHKSVLIDITPNRLRHHRLEIKSSPIANLNQQKPALPLPIRWLSCRKSGCNAGTKNKSLRVTPKNICSQRIVSNMTEKTETGNESLENPLAERSTTEAASNHPVTKQQLEKALTQLQSVLETQINKYYDQAWLGGGAQNHLYDTPDGIFFAFSPTWLYNEEHVQELGFDKEMFNAVIDAHRNQASIWGFDVDRPTTYGNNLVDDYSPFYIAYPENWLEAQYHARLRMMRLLQYHLTPAEALDYWALKDSTASLSSNSDRDRWHAFRGVDREAVNKTLRQAEDKLEKAENHPYDEKQEIQTKEVEKL